MSKPIHTYVDLDVVNNNLNSSAGAPQLRFEETRIALFGRRQQRVFLFHSQVLYSLPSFIPRIETGQGDIKNKVYKATLYLDACKGNYFQVNVSLLYVASDSVADLPQPPIIQQDMRGTYYYQLCIKDIVKMFNTGLKSAWDALLAMIPIRTDQFDKTGPHYIFKGACTPFFEYDYDKCRLVLNIDQTFPTGII